VSALRTMNVQSLHTMMAGASESLALVPVIQQATNPNAKR